MKESCRAATTANITISTALNNGDTLDGVTLATGDRVLVKDQSTASQNGIYLVGSSPAREYDESTDDPSFGYLVFVREGTVNAATLWVNTNTSTPTIGSTSLTFALVTGGGGGTLSWFNVMDYGAVNDGSTNDRTAINAAIAAFNAAGEGVLYFPAGLGYAVSGGALTTITANGLVIGDGMGAYDGSAYASAILFNSQTAVCFTHTGRQLLFRDLGIFNTYSGTPSAGAGIQVSGSFIGQKVDLDSVVVSGFYVNVDRQAGSQWSNRNVWNWGAVSLGEKIQNTVNQDAGDWIIEGCNYYADTDNPAALIRVVGAGGGKIVGNKINGHGGATATTGIEIAIPNGVSTGVFNIAGNSIENVSGDAMLITTTGTGAYHSIAISGNQVGLYGNNTGRAVKISAATQGTTVGAAGSILVVTIDGMVAATDGTARAAVELVNTDRVTLGDIQLYGFNARYTSSGDTNTTDSGAAAALTVKDEGSTLDTAVSSIDFVGAGVTATNVSHAVTVTIPSTLHSIVVATSHSTPLIFGDLVQTTAGDDLVYTS